MIAAGSGELIDLVHLAEAGEPLRSSGIGLTAEGRLDAVGGEPQARAEVVVEEHEPVELGLANLQAFLAGRDRVLGTSLKEIEQRLVHLALERTGGNLTAAAQMLGMSRAQISYRLKGSDPLEPAVRRPGEGARGALRAACSEFQPVGLALGAVVHAAFVLPLGAEEPAFTAVLHGWAEGEAATPVAVVGVHDSCRCCAGLQSAK